MPVTHAQKPAPPLSTRECADLIGVSLDFVLDSIKDGSLKAEVARRTPASRPIYRVHEDDYLDWLTRIGWSRLPYPALAARTARTA
jgi:hypothetical protein